MIKIEPSTKGEVKKFNDSVWKNADLEHYGKITNWITKEFVFKAVEGEETVGSIIGVFEAGVLIIHSMLVKETSRGKGIGRMLMEKAEEFGKKEGAHKLAVISGVGVRNYYRKLGFKLENTYMVKKLK